MVHPLFLHQHYEQVLNFCCGVIVVGRYVSQEDIENTAISNYVNTSFKFFQTFTIYIF